MLEHAGLCNLAATQAELLHVGPGSRFLQFSSLSFDACTWECAVALAAGACLYLGTRESLAPGERLLSTLRERGITHALLPPAALSACSATRTPSSLTTLVVGGEACSARLVHEWSPGRQLINAYGPTEATVCATMHWCADDEGNPPIGRPLPNARVYVLDERLEPLPIGVAGEIYIGGVGVARGYLNRPELTAQRFRDDPFCPGGRIYQTGDLGRWRRDGSLEYFGRNDHQVKIRGYRIELGEIEAALTRQPGVTEAVVIVREDTPGEKRLVAYVVGTAPVAPADDLRACLSTVLPDYMVPSAIVRLDRLPLTPNGKLDRESLPPPDGAQVHARYEAPAGATEQAVAAAWCELLQLSCVGRHDNFFDLGGHSLLAARLLENIDRDLALRLSLRDLFEAPTVATLSARIESYGETVQGSGMADSMLDLIGAVSELTDEEVSAMLESKRRERGAGQHSSA
jgi:acyl-coenzyme A synthetase/AMP-(fatty) acid ligase